MSDPTTNPLGLFWLLILLFSCGLVTVMALPMSDSGSIDEEFPTEPEVSTDMNAESAKNAANADVMFVRAVQTGADTWTFHVTVAHPDTGWDDYADGWDVVLPNGRVILPNPADPFTRLLLHPHENEQPFTRSQSGIVIPADVTRVTVRAHDLVDGWGGQDVIVDLSADSGLNFEVERQ